MLDVAEAFTAIDTSYAYYGSQHQSSGLVCYFTYCLPNVAVALSKLLSNGHYIFTGSDQVFNHNRHLKVLQ